MIKLHYIALYKWKIHNRKIKVCFLRVKKQVDEKRSTVDVHTNADSV